MPLDSLEMIKNLEQFLRSDFAFYFMEIANVLVSIININVTNRAVNNLLLYKFFFYCLARLSIYKIKKYEL